MREYGQIQSSYWTHPVIKSKNALDFRKPLHRKVRAFVFNRDGFICRICGAKPESKPEQYDGSDLVYVTDRNGNRVYLIVEHIKSRRCGGNNHPDNLQCACETCNREKIKQDKAEFLALKIDSGNIPEVKGGV